MKTAQDYDVSFGYGAKTTLNGKPYVHRGKDRATPTGTLVFPGNTNILTGNTGLSTGPHVHTQAGTDKACQNTIDPTPYEFKPGKVVAFGTGTQWGKYVTLQVGSHFITYAHLSKITVKIGETVGEEMYKGKSAEFWYDADQKHIGIAERRLQDLKATQKERDALKRIAEDRRKRLIAGHNALKVTHQTGNTAK